MDLFIVKAKNKKDLEKISDDFLSEKFNVIQIEDNFILMKKRRYGNIYVHALFLLIGLFYIWPLLIVNLAYFTYSYLWASPHVLITTEIKSEDGEILEFNTIDEVIKCGNKLF